MIWILLSVFAATILFVVFKLFDKYHVDRFSAVVFNYFFAGITGVLIYQVNLDSFSNCSTCLWFVAGLGIIFISLFSLLAYVTSKNGASIAVLANKMAFVLPVILSIFLFDEAITLLLGFALVIGLIGLYLAVKPKDFNQNKNSLIWPLVLFIGSGILDFLLKVGDKYVLQSWTSTTLTVGIFTSALLWGTLYGVQQKKLILNAKNVLWGAILGIPNFFSIFFLFNAIGFFSEQSVIIFPINNVGIILGTTLTALLVFKEKLTKTNVIGLLLCILSILVLAYNA